MHFTVTFSYNKKKSLYNEFNLELKENKITVLCGHNGAGKSTLFRVISGIYPTTRENTVGWYVSSSGGLVQHFTLSDHLKLMGISNFRDNELLRLFDEKIPIGEFMDKKISKLSTGQAMLVSLFIAIASPEKLLLLDEPFGPLDPVNAELLCEILQHVKQEKTILISSHDLYLTSELADIILFLKNGNIVWNSEEEQEQSLDVDYIKTRYKELA